MTELPSPSRQQTAAVVGLGATGIVAVKNLLEAGFDVAGFERSDYLGGLWHFTENEESLSVLESTLSTVTVDQGGFTDFPYPNDIPTYCTGKQVEDYLEAYADHFNLRSRFRLSTAVSLISREDDAGKWRLDLEGKPSERFDKVVVATGAHARPLMPEFEGAELFTGRRLHSRAFKRPQDFAGMKVVIVGLGNTSCDIADTLIGHASSISLSYNHGAVIVPRLLDGRPITDLSSYRSIKLQAVGNSLFPSLAGRLFDHLVRRIMWNTFGELNPAWGLHPAPSLQAANPVVCDTLIANFTSGAVQPAAGIRRFTGGRRMELTDGQVIDADAVIYSTGYKNNFGMLETRYDPSANPAAAWLETAGSKGRPYPRLYRNVFSLEAPGSLAFLGCVYFPTGAFCLADLASMCIAQVWAGKSSLPPLPEMAQWVDRQEQRMCKLAQRGSVIPGAVLQRDWLRWADRTAGMGMEEHLGWGWQGWLFWWRERKLWSMLMDGIMTSAVWRLFDGKRKRWDGARAEVVRLNEAAKERRFKAKALKKGVATYDKHGKSA